MSLYNLRINYDQDSLLEDNLPKDPMILFDAWFKQSAAKEPNAMCLSTVIDNKPSSRIVLCKSYSTQGFTFFTNYNSRKGMEIESNPFASIVFYWEQRSVRIEGKLDKISDKESTDYFSSRPRESQIGAWTSPQSTVLKNRQELDDFYYKTVEKFKNVENIPKPEFWGGYILRPTSIEFWQGRPSRLHDRIKYILQNSCYKIVRLAPQIWEDEIWIKFARLAKIWKKMIELILIFGGFSWILYNYWKYLKRKRLNSLGPKRRFITEKSQIPKVVLQKKVEKTIYFTPAKTREQVFFSTPHLPFKTPRNSEMGNFTPIVKLDSKEGIEAVKIPVKSMEQRPIEIQRNLGPIEIQNNLQPLKLQQDNLNFQHSQLSTPQKSIESMQLRVEKENSRVETGKSNKRAFNDEELTQVKKSRKEVRYKTPRRDRDTLKRKSTFTVLDNEIDKELLPEKGWITPMSRRLGRKASRSTQIKERTSVMCQTMPVQQESKRIKVTPALDRVKFKIPESISRPVLQGNELDEKTVQVLLNAANEGISGSFVIGKEASSIEAIKAPPLEFKAPLAKENISPSFKVDGAVAPVPPLSAPSTVATEVTPEVPKFNFNLPVSTSVSTGTLSPQKPALTFSLPGSETPILSTVPARDSDVQTPKFSFGAPSSITSTAVTTSTMATAVTSSIATFGTLTASTGPASTPITSMPFSISTTAPPVTAAATSDTITPTFNFGKPSSGFTPLPTVTAPTTTTAPVSFSFGGKTSEVPAVSLTSFGSKETTAASAAPTLNFGVPSSTAAAPIPSAPQTTPFSFGKTPTVSTTPSTFNFGSSNVPPATLAPQSGGLSQPVLGNQSSKTAAPMFGQLNQTSQPPATSAFGGTTAPPVFGQPAPSATSTFGQSTSAPFGQSVSVTATPSFGQPAPITSATFGQPATSASVPSFGQAIPSTSAPFGQSAPVQSPFGQTKAAPFGPPSISTSTSAFGQSAPSSSVSSPFGQTTTAPGSFGAAAPFGTTTAPPTFGQSPSTSAPPPFGQPFGQQSGNTGFGMTSGASAGQGSSAPAFGQPTSGFPPSSFGQGSTSNFNQSTPAAPFGSAPSPFGNTSTNAPSAPSFGFSNASVQFGAQAPANPQAPFNTPSGSAFTFGQPQATAPSFSFGAQSPGIAPASPGFSFNAPGAPQLPQMPSGPGFSLGAGGDTTRKLAQPKGRLRKAGLRR